MTEYWEKGKKVYPFFGFHIFSNFYFNSSFTCYDYFNNKITRKYNSTEQYYHAQKALCFKDNIMFNKIMKTTEPKLQKSFGNKVSNYNEEIWNKHRFNIMFIGLYAKFTQIEIAKKKLLETNDMYLVEASPYDKLWGAGISEKSKKINDPSKYPGKNMLGILLMQLRDELRQKEERLI